MLFILGGYWWLFVMGELIFVRRSGMFSRMDGNLFGRIKICFGYYGDICNCEKWLIREFKIFMINYFCFFKEYFKIFVKKSV